MPGTSASRDEIAFYNPAFLAAAMRSTASGYQSMAGRGIPVPLLLPAVVIAAFLPLRSLLPRTIRTHHATWISNTPGFRPEFQRLFTTLVEPLRSALLLAVEANAVSVDGIEVSPGGLTLNPSDPSEETEDVMRAARFLGRWYARSGPAATTLSLLGFES